MRDLKIAPSILAANLARLGEDVHSIESAVDMLHIDVMDGHFVPNISFGMPVIASLRPVSQLYFDCHMMTTNPDVYFEDLAGVGVDLVSMHIEALPDPTEAVSRARSVGLDVGLVLNPPTPFSAVAPFVETVDMVLIMSVQPGFGGQSFMGEVLGKVEEAREWVQSRGLDVDIQIDGGINLSTARRARAAGANVFVAGSAVFGSADPLAAVEDLRRAISEK